ncbi:hypothetical protein PFICI_12515 [Pestalotiopsis fici W106-1]|uniref:Tyrosinase copper-binding domain-containing protein n=1 Tax=Pestalotiopsis fici (strain W106-1 / CGMCC3.15140) TaxID=1229662 RepID=W3WRX0_PESFW|nr:uncharacterized protein PFICI_12515 [Pestalotiopsis fici W106-1]ETS75571.1 hypothetical protein PFICI_12515 [Pestalotiopsis fici W106-1]
MPRLLKLGTSLLGLSAAASASPHGLAKRDECETLRQVKAWTNFTSTEKSAYIDAALCLTTAEPTIGLGDSATVWQEMQYAHIGQVTWIHNVGQFLPWHRYFVTVHANFLRDLCGYEGPLAYWDESADAQLTDLTDAEIFQADAFGGDGVGSSKCIEDGPFVDTVLHPVNTTGSGGNSSATNGNTCIWRSLSLNSLDRSSYVNVETCLEKDTWEGAWNCIEGSPHGGGHGGVGGVMLNVANSPGDPLFFLHHSFIDLLWWRWQSADLDTRLTEISGINSQSQSSCDRQGLPCAGPEILDYDGDDGNQTTLNHVLWMMDLSPNVTVADVMNTNSSSVCLEYIW